SYRRIRTRADGDARPVQHATSYFAGTAVVGEMRAMDMDVIDNTSVTAGLNPQPAASTERRINARAFVCRGLVVAPELTAIDLPAGYLRSTALIGVVDDNAAKRVVQE